MTDCILCELGFPKVRRYTMPGVDDLGRPTTISLGEPAMRKIVRASYIPMRGKRQRFRRRRFERSFGALLRARGLPY